MLWAAKTLPAVALAVMLPRGPADVAQAEVEGEEKPGFSHGRARRGKGRSMPRLSAARCRSSGDFE